MKNEDLLKKMEHIDCTTSDFTQLFNKVGLWQQIIFFSNFLYVACMEVDIF